ncbi:MAG: hypothetical protein ACR2K3_04605 [Nocardioides sp.]
MVPGALLISHQGRPISVATLDRPTDQPLHRGEESLVRNAIPQRCTEFATSRACVRAALARLGAETGPLLRHDRGAPVWPSSVTGSISHTRAS